MFRSARLIAATLGGVVLPLVSVGQTQFPTTSPPSVASSAFLPWCEAYVNACVESVPVSRRTTYYCSPDGDDTTGDGSLARPWRTVAKANGVLSSGTGDV